MFSCKGKKQTFDFDEIGIVKDANHNIIMTKSGIADSNNVSYFKYYDTTGRLVFIIEWGGVDSSKRMISPQIVDAGINSNLAGEYFYREYLLGLFGQPHNFQIFLENRGKNDGWGDRFNTTDSVLFHNYKFHLSKNEFENLLKFLNNK